MTDEATAGPLHGASPCGGGGSASGENQSFTGEDQVGEKVTQEPNGTTVSAGWFGPTPSTFGWLHVPVGGRARGGVVICSPIGHDYRLAYTTLRLLADRLAARGIAALRFDYHGTGESGGSAEEPDRVESWLQSGADAVAFMRGCSLGWVGMVGMRLGSSLASSIARGVGGVNGIVLWDPSTGRQFLSEQRALAGLALGLRTRVDGSQEIPGVVLAGQTVGDLRQLGGEDRPERPAPRALCLIREERPLDQEKLAARLPGVLVEWGTAEGQSDLMDSPPECQVVPARTIDRIVEWVVEQCPNSDSSLESVALRPVIALDGARAVAETAVITSGSGLFGIVSEPVRPLGGPTVVFLNVANDHRSGPNRMWTVLARTWAQAGIRSARFDLSGLGDSAIREGQPREVLRTPEHFDDVLEIAGTISPEDPSEVVLVGLCSSGYQVIESAFELRPRAICSINPIFSFPVPEVEAGRPMDSRRRVARPRTAIVDAFRRDNILWPLMERFPKALWFCRNLISPRRSGLWLSQLDAAGVNTFCMVGEYEARQIHGGSERTIKRLASKGRLVMRIVPGLDHDLLTEESRTTVDQELTSHLARLFPDADLT